jgi:uncharacterized protein (DUF1501 family)
MSTKHFDDGLSGMDRTFATAGMLAAGAVSRREALRRSFAGAAGLLMADQFALPALAAATPAKASPNAKAKSVIQIWLWGGAPQLDTFDPKPETGNDYAGPFKAIETNVSGIRVCELLPLLAKQADKYALIRSMTHGSNAHETATYMVQTGRPAGERVIYPGVGAVVSLMKGASAGYAGQLPPYIVLTEPLGRFDEAGFLSARHKPFITGGDPSQPRFMVEGIVAEGLSDERQRDRRELLNALNRMPRALPGNPALQALARSEEQAYDMILGDGAKVFDLATEKDEVRESYGRNKFGQSCLMARRLVEQGVPYVTINYNGWDTHKDNFATLRRKLPELDKGLATLLQELSERGLLSSTVVWCGGEFGRTPRVDWSSPWNGGRGHWGAAFSTLLAGGGIRGGQVLGATDARGEEVKERPVAPAEVIGGLYALLGIDPQAKLPHPQGEDARVAPGAPAGGFLKELI